MSRRWRGILASGAVAFASFAAAAPAAAVELVAVTPTEFSSPTYVTSPPGEPDRLIITEKAGMVWQSTPSGITPYLDLTADTAPEGEQGLWSVAFAPDFAQSRRFYVAYSAPDGAPQLVEFREGANAAETEASARSVLVAEDDPGSTNHNGGQLQFGPDGFLYWSLGDDNHAELAPDINSLRGKLLRIDPRGEAPGQYSVPPGNPFAGPTPGRNEIWSTGLRNPWRFSFDRFTGALTIGDVGAGTREEVNYVTRAAGGGRAVNFGWPACEGRFGDACADPGLTAPVYDYTNPPAGGAAVAGGYVVRDPDLGDLFGRYLFADSYSSELRSIDPTAATPTDAHRTEPLSASSIHSFGEDSCGRLYAVSGGDGHVYRLQGATGGACPPPPPADTDPPQTSLELKRRGPRSRKVVFRISSDEPQSTFRCRFDKGRWRACGKRHRIRGLDPGSHKFRAVATDLAGNVDPRPAKKHFEVKRRKRHGRG